MTPAMPGSAPRCPRWASARSVWAVVALVLGAGLAGCGSDGRDLREPSARQTTTSRPPSSATAEIESPAAPPMQLSSEAFVEGAAVPEPHTCRGEDVSPPLMWSGVPAETVELAVVVRDLDADGFVHWVVAGLPPTVGGLARDTVPDEAVEAANDFGESGWRGPCPDSGTHHYEFRLYALAQNSGVTAGQPGAEAARGIETAPALASAALSASFSPPTG